MAQVGILIDAGNRCAQFVYRFNHDRAQQEADYQDTGKEQRQLNHCHLQYVVADLFIQIGKIVGYTHRTQHSSLWYLVTEQTVGAFVG